MAIKTTAEQLEEVQEAISAVMTSQEFESGRNRRVLRARLDHLHAREEVLLRRYRAEQGNGGPVITTGIIRRDR